MTLAELKKHVEVFMQICDTYNEQPDSAKGDELMMIATWDFRRVLTEAKKSSEITDTQVKQIMNDCFKKKKARQLADK